MNARHARLVGVLAVTAWLLTACGSVETVPLSCESAINAAEQALDAAEAGDVPTFADARRLFDVEAENCRRAAR